MLGYFEKKTIFDEANIDSWYGKQNNVGLDERNFSGILSKACGFDALTHQCCAKIQRVTHQILTETLYLVCNKCHLCHLCQ